MRLFLKWTMERARTLQIKPTVALMASDWRVLWMTRPATELRSVVSREAMPRMRAAPRKRGTNLLTHLNSSLKSLASI